MDGGTYHDKSNRGRSKKMAWKRKPLVASENETDSSLVSNKSVASEKGEIGGAMGVDKGKTESETAEEGEEEKNLLKDHMKQQFQGDGEQHEDKGPSLDHHGDSGMLPYSHSVDETYRECPSSLTSTDNEEEVEMPVEINADKYNIDWTEVAAGKAAGIPGQWEQVSSDVEEGNHTLSSAIGDDLCQALQMKAAAYTDQDWQSYWSSNGPYILASYWRECHPKIPLKRVEVISGLGFLCTALENMMTLRVEKEESNCEEAVGSQTTPTFESTWMDSHSDEKTEADTGGMKRNEPSDNNAVQMEDEQVLSLWNTFYNEMYWYVYSQYKYQTEGQVNDESEGLMNGGWAPHGSMEEDEEPQEGDQVH